MTESPLLDVEEAAAYLRVTPDWLAAQARREVIPSRRVGRRRRFLKADLDEYLDRVRVGQDPWARTPAQQARRSRRAS